MRGERVCPISVHGQSWPQWVTDSKPIREGPCARLAKKSSPWMNKRNAGNSQEIEQRGKKIYIYIKVKFGLLLYQIQRDSRHQSDTLLHTKPVEGGEQKHTYCIFNSKVRGKTHRRRFLYYCVSAFKIKFGWKTFPQHNQSCTGSSISVTHVIMQPFPVLGVRAGLSVTALWCTGGVGSLGREGKEGCCPASLRSWRCRQGGWGMLGAMCHVQTSQLFN